LRETASYELSCVKISSVDFPVEEGKKKRKGKGRHKKSRKRYISPIRGESPREQIFTKFCTSGDMLDVIICANFGVEKLRGLGNTRGQILEFPIEMAGQLYNRAGATAQPVMLNKTFLCHLQKFLKACFYVSYVFKNIFNCFFLFLVSCYLFLLKHNFFCLVIGPTAKL